MLRGARGIAASVLLLAIGVLWVLAWREVDWSGQGLLALGPLVAVLSGVLLLPVAVLVRGRTAHVVTGALCALLILPIVPLAWHTVLPGGPGPGDLRVLTWNMQNHAQAVRSLESAVAAYDPDLVVVEQAPVGASRRTLDGAQEAAGGVDVADLLHCGQGTS